MSRKSNINIKINAKMVKKYIITHKPVKIAECIKNREVRIITAYKYEQAMQKMKLKMEKSENQQEYTKRTATVESPSNINMNFNAFTCRDKHTQNTK